jgi:hypothetical protein
LPIEKALDILKMEVDRKKLDADLYRIFLDARIFELGRPAQPLRKAA